MKEILNVLEKYMILKYCYSYKGYKAVLEGYKNGMKIDDISKVIVGSKFSENSLADKFNERLEYQKIEIITIFDDIYPTILKEIQKPPIVFLYKGDLKLLKKEKLSIVGSRRAPEIYFEIGRNIASLASEKNISIVSGMALGMDRYVHLGGLSGKGSSIGVLPCGFNSLYPESNRDLYKEMNIKGGLLTEFPFGVKMKKFHFLRRNRIIAGLSKKLVIVHGLKKSGSFITMDYALEENRDVVISKMVAGELGIDNSSLDNLIDYLYNLKVYDSL